MKNKSFRLSEEVTEKISELLKGRQITTNQLFEEFIVLAEQKVVDPKLNEEDTVLESSLRQITLLFQERATRLKTLQYENQRIKSRHLETVTDLEMEVIQTKEKIEMEYTDKLCLNQQKLDQLQSNLEKAEVALTKSMEQRERFEVTKKEEITALKREVFHMEGTITKLEEERDQLYRQNKTLADMVDEFKTRSLRAEKLEEENHKLFLELTVAQRDQEAFERQLHEQVELAILRERTRLNP